MFPAFRNQINCHLKRRKSLNLCFKRNLKKDHWAVLERKVAPHDKALKHFDDFYKELFKKKWPSVRLALQERNKQVALLNNFGDVNETIQLLQGLGAFDLKTYFDMHEEIVMNKLRAEVEGEEDDVELLESSATGSTKRALASKAIQKQLQTSESELDILYPDTYNKKEVIKKILLEDEEDPEKLEEIDEIEFQSVDNETVEYDKDRIVDPEIGMSSAALNEFVPATKLMGLEDYVPEQQYYKYYEMETTGFKVNIEKEYLLEYPRSLKVYTFDRGDISRYPEPVMDSANVFNYYILDGASVLTVLALGVQPGDYVLDMCAAPGGKSLTILQTLNPDLVVCNEKNTARHRRLTQTIDKYFYDSKWKEKIRITKQDALLIEENEFYNKILVDVPCTNDKVSLYKDDNNFFTDNRIKERLQLPEIQSQLLAHALKLVHPKGTVVYSTCTLSPVQNDGVVHMALQQVWNDTGMEFTVIDMTPALQCTKQLFNYGDYLNLRYGHLVVPFLPSNFGPMYFCKIKKN